MSQENVEAIRAAFEQYSRGDFSLMFAGMTDDFEFVTAKEMPDAGRYSGQEARAWLTAYMGSFDGFRMEATEIIDAGNKTVSAVVQRARPCGSEGEVESHWWQVVTFRADGVARLEMFSRRDQALEAAGLSD
jgi:ketosteroid isomerase-like protein